MGADTLVGGAGADTMIGGAGIDTVSYADHTADVTLTLGPGADGAGGGAEGDSVGVDVENAIGGDGNDTLSGQRPREHDQRRRGRRPYLRSGGERHPARQRRQRHARRRRWCGHLGRRPERTCSSAAAAVATRCPTPTTRAGRTPRSGTARTTARRARATTYRPTSRSSRAARATTRSLAANNDTLFGNAGNDTLDGMAGNDTLYGNAGGRPPAATAPTRSTAAATADALNGGNSIDTASYSTRTNPVTVTIGAGALDDGEAGEGDSVAADVENATGGNAGDTMRQRDREHAHRERRRRHAERRRGNDTLDGGLGADMLDGGVGARRCDVRRDGQVSRSRSATGPPTTRAARGRQRAGDDRKPCSAVRRTTTSRATGTRTHSAATRARTRYAAAARSMHSPAA